jgi:hypothetical protein
MPVVMFAPTLTVFDAPDLSMVIRNVFLAIVVHFHEPPPLGTENVAVPVCFWPLQ